MVVVPRSGWLDAFLDAGIPPLLAAELVDLHDADRRGLLRPRSDRRRTCTTTLGRLLTTTSV